MARVLLGVTGSVAAVRAPELHQALTSAGHSVLVAVTPPALYFFDPNDLAPASRCPDAPPGGPVYRDLDEWPGKGYRRGDPVLHIELRKWADVLIVAPVDANTLAKFALGLADNLLTCVFRAWGPRPVVLAPAMNTLMWEAPATLRHLRQLLEDFAGPGDVPPAGPWGLADAPAIFARHAPRLILVPPQAKRLACGDFGIGAMAEVPAIAEAVRLWAEPESSAG